MRVFRPQNIKKVPASFLLTAYLNGAQMTYNEESYTGGTCACPEELRQYFDDGTIDGYERVLSEGKEAVVHVVSKSGAGKRYYAAKVYKKREERAFKNRADYLVTQNLFAQPERAGAAAPGYPQSLHLLRQMRRHDRPGRRFQRNVDKIPVKRPLSPKRRLAPF